MPELKDRVEDDGDTTPNDERLSPDAQRFASRVNVTPTCHYWTGATDKDGYGTFNADGKKYRAHVYAYVQAYGPVPEGLEVDHLCHRRNCVNPQHLEAKTHIANLAQRSDRISDEPAYDAGLDAELETLSADLISAEPEVTRGPGGRFLPGMAPKSPGRPRKGRSILDTTQELAERRWKQVARAAVARLERDDAVGNRAWSDYRDTFHGVPKQTLVLQQGADPLAELYASIAAAGGAIAPGDAPIYIEAPSDERPAT